MAGAPQSRLEVLRTLRSANLDVAFITIFGTAVGGTFLIGCIKYLGADDFWIGLVSAIGALVGLVQIPGAVWGKSKYSFKSFVAPGGWTWRLLYIPVAIMPILLIANELKLILIVLCIGVGGTAVNLVGSTYNEWLGVLIPERSRGWFFSQRTVWTTIIGATAGLLFGATLDQFKRFGLEGPGYTTIFGIGCLAGIISMICYMQMADIKRQEVVRPDMRATFTQILAPLRHKNFRALLIFTAIFTASQAFAGNFFTAYGLETLKLPFFILTLKDVANAVGIVVMVKTWGFLADKYGNKPVLALLMFGVVLTPFIWVLCRPSDLPWNTTVLLLGHLFNGFVWSGVGVTQFNLNLATGREEHRANSLALIGAVSALAGAIAPLLGSAVMTYLRVRTGDPYHSYLTLFYIASGSRLIALVALLPVRERGATSIRQTLTHLRSIKPSGVAALRTIQSSDNQDRRAAAIEIVGSSQFTLATTELETALVDPSPRVRRKAAQALGRLGTPEAARAVLKHVTNHPDLVEDEMLEALVQAPVAESVPYLIGVLDHPRALLRRTAARALGQIGDAGSVDALVTAALKPGDQDMRRASIQALRQMGVGELAVEAYRNGLADSSFSVRTAAAEAVSELELHGLAPELRAVVLSQDGSPVPEVVYALGCVGDLNDLPLILECARDAKSRSTRRRCLLGVAKLLNVEAEVYRLMSLEGMARDTALYGGLRAAMRRDEALSKAVERYSSGDEGAAVQALAEARPTRVFRDLEECLVEESFLVAVAAFVHSPRD